MGKINHKNNFLKKIRTDFILISNKEDSRAKKITKTKKEHYIKVKESIHKDDITVLNVNAPNNRVLNYMKQKLIELIGKIEKSMIRAKDFNTSLSEIELTTGWKISNDTEDLTQSNNRIYLAYTVHSTKLH